MGRIVYSFEQKDDSLLLRVGPVLFEQLARFGLTEASSAQSPDLTEVSFAFDFLLFY